MQLSLFDIPQPKIELEELFDAYFNCRINKRNTANALAFEIDYENNLVQLCKEINNGTYQIGRSIAFIMNKPVIREIFAADSGVARPFIDRRLPVEIDRRERQFVEPT